MKKQITKIIILINIIIGIMIVSSVNLVQAVNNTSNSSNKINSSNTSNITNTSNTITSTSVAGTSNAKLSNLGLTKYDFTGFTPDTTSYAVTIPENVTEVEVYAKTQDSEATYSVSGNKNLKVGENKVTITVTASDGKTKKEYYIMVRRLGNATENTEEVENEESQPNVNEETVGKKDQSDITRYSTPHTEVGWYIVGISLALVTILLIIFIIIDDKKEPKKKNNKNYEQNHREIDNNIQSNNIDPNDVDSQATKVMDLRSIRNTKNDNYKKGKHF